MSDTRPLMGPYEVLEVIGKGGMATVYRGRRRETGQTVALKVMAPDAAANPTLVKRFQHEFAAALRLRHPNIIQVWDYGLEGGRPYLVMEYIEGENLGRRIARQGPMPEADALPVLLQVADGLHAAHERQMIHRDVKSDNVLLGKDGQAKLTDLGLIKDFNDLDELTKTRTCLGTIAFVAPEQFEDAKRADVRADIYGLGATLYHAVTGVPPFQGKRNLQILRKKFANDFVSPRRLVPSLSRHIDAVICQALNARPDRRPASCREFIDALLAGEAPDASAADAQPRGETIVDPADERRALRYPADFDARCRPVQGGRHHWDAKIQDISGAGVCLQVERRFEPGSVLAVDVLPAEPAGIPTLFAKVLWVRQVGPRKWCVGCAFRQALDPGELETVLGGKSRTVVVQQE